MQTLYTSLLTIEELSTASARLLPLLNPLLAGNAVLSEIATAAQAHHDASSWPSRARVPATTPKP